MPRIPESQFNTSASTRVGEADIRPDTGGGLSNLTKSVAGLTGVFAQLQDQTERTEAYTKANAVKKDYLKQKAFYESALQRVDADGNFTATDPFDDNKDPEKRRSYSGHISDEYKKLKEVYDAGKASISGITRSDIAGEMLDDIVGEDLINLNLKTNREVNRVRDKAVKETAIENINLEMSKVFDNLSADTYSPDTVKAMVSRSHSKIQKQIALIAPVMGGEGTSGISKIVDQSYSNAASQLIQMNMNNSTVTAAESLINKISNPQRKSLAMAQLERTKKTTATVKLATTLNATKGMEEQMNKTPIVTADEAMRIGNTLESLRNSYVDPKYSAITREQVDARADSLATTFLTKAMMQDYSEAPDGLDFLSLIGRNPSGDIEQDIQMLAAPEKLAILKQQIGQKMDDLAGFGTKLSSEKKTALIDMTVEKMKAGMSDFGKKLPSVIKHNNPNIGGRELIEKTVLAGYNWGIQGISLVGKEDVSAFKRDFQSAMAKDSTQALMLFESKIAQAGELMSGEESYRRALAIDLADKDPKMSFIIPMAEADPLMKERMIQTARTYKDTLKENKHITETNLHRAFGDLAGDTFLSGLRSTADTSLYNGIKQTALHFAADIAARDNTDVDKAMGKALDMLKTQYASAQTRDGRASVVAVNTPAINFRNRQRDLEAGLGEALTLPKMTKQEKIEVLRKMPDLKKDVTDNISDEHLNFLLKASVKVKPDPRFPNMHTYHIGDTALPIANAKREVIKISAEEIAELGAKKKAKPINARQAMEGL